MMIPEYNNVKFIYFFAYIVQFYGFYHDWSYKN